MIGGAAAVAVAAACQSDRCSGATRTLKDANAVCLHGNEIRTSWRRRRVFVLFFLMAVL